VKRVSSISEKSAYITHIASICKTLSKQEPSGYALIIDSGDKKELIDRISMEMPIKVDVINYPST
jgi:hypothetical protein